MITITQDAEFMVNLVSANPIPAGNYFFAFSDENSNPAVLSHSEDNKLNLVLEVNGTAQLFDFGNICGLSGDVQAFALLQDSDLNVWVAVATDAGTDDNGDDWSNLYLIINLQPSALLDPPADNIIQASDTYKKIQGMYMSSFTRNIGGLLFPMLFVASQPLDSITAEDQLGYVKITVDSDQNTSISLDTSWTLATNPLKILDVTFGHCPVGKGAFVLYTTDNKTNPLKLQFRVFEGDNFSVELNAPSGAQCLTAYNDDDTNYTVFLVGGDVITQYTYDDYKKSTGTGTTIVSDSDSQLGIKDIHNAQDGDNITVWYTTSSDAAYYYSATTSSMSSGLLVQLLPDGAGGQISGRLSSKNNDDTLVNTLISVDESGDLTILQQASDTKMWASHPFYIPSTTDNLEIPGFTVRIKAHTDVISPAEEISGCQLHLTSSGFMRVQSNGSTAALDQNGAWYQADHTGTVTIIITTTDMSCHTLQVDKFQATGQDELALDIPPLVPSSKINAKLAAITSGQDLLNAKTQSGQDLIESGTVSSDDADTAATMIDELNKEQITMSTDAGNTPGPKLPSPVSKRRRNIVHIAGRLPPGRKILQRLTTADSTDSGSSLWDYFLFLYDKAKEVESWVLQRVDDVLHFVITWAGTVYSFVCDTVAAIGKALSWVFAKIKVGVEKMIDYAGFIFKWNDILQFSDSIVTYFNVSLQYGQDQIDALDDKAKSFIENLRETLHNRVQPNTVSANTTTEDTSATSDTNGVKHGVGYNWPGYQLNHGGFQKDSQMSISTITSDEQDAITNIWTDFNNELEVIKDLVNDIGNTLCSLFNSNTDSSELFNQFTDDMIDALCDSFENILDIFLKSIVLLLQKVSDLANYAIEIPVFTALWKDISEGRDFTLLNAIALIVAIPATVLYKLVTDTPLPALKDRLTEDVFTSFLSGDSSLDSALAQDIETVRSVSVVVAGYILFEVTALTFAIDTITGDAGGAEDIAAVTTAASEAGSRARNLRGTTLVSVLVGNIIDSVTLVLTGAGLVFSWPLWYGDDVDFRWWVWGLDVSNGIFLAVSRLIGWITGIARVETKRFVGVYELATAYPIFILSLIIAVDEYQLPDNDDLLTTRHVVEDVFQLVSCGGFCVAATADDIQDEVTAVGLAVFGLSTGLKFAFKFVDFVFWVDKVRREQ